MRPLNERVTRSAVANICRIFQAQCRLAGQEARRRGHPVVVAHWMDPTPALAEPITLLAAANDIARRTFFWSTADGTSLLAVGSIKDMRASGLGRFTRAGDAWRTLLAHHVGPPPGPMLVGGFAFADTHHCGVSGLPWAPRLPPALLWVPPVVLRADATGGQLCLTAVVRPGEDERAGRPAVHALAALLGAQPAGATGTRAGATLRAGSGTRVVAVSPSPSAWMGLVERALGEIGRGSFAKVVLARQVQLRARRGFDVPGLVAGLTAARSGAITVIAVRLGRSTFVSATPERLVRVSAGVVESASLAASGPRHDDTERDAALQQEFVANGKARHEQALVTDAIRDALRPLCTELEAAEVPEVLDLPGIRHLITRVTGRLAASRQWGALELAGRLHPTPAVGGYPSGPALRWMRAVEPIDRSWYAGPVGWVGASGDGEFAVAIRSALITGGCARLYAGAGIVAGSDPAAELAETDLKLQAMRCALDAAVVPR